MIEDVTVLEHRRPKDFYNILVYNIIVVDLSWAFIMDFVRNKQLNGYI